MTTLRRRWAAADADVVRTPRDDLVRERLDDDGVFRQEHGPLPSYERRVTPVDGGDLDERIDYRLGLPWFGWMFAPLTRHALWHRPLRHPPGAQPWWAPPDRLDQRGARILGLLAAASLSAAFVNTLFTQTVSFAARDFGVSNSGQGLAGTIVRLGIVLVLPVVLLADRIGRRRAILWCAYAAPVCCALGAAAPSFAVLTATQAIGRPLGIALDLLVAVVAAEEMAKNSRAYAVSVLAMASGLGAGLCVLSLRLADIGPGAWRLVYLVALVWIVVAADLSRRLPETLRFRQHEHDPQRHRARGARLAAQAGAAFFANLFVAPASFFQNRYLDEVRGFSGGRIALFTLTTSTPAVIGILVGGRIADRSGRRVLGATSLVLGTALFLCSFAVGGWPMWAAAMSGGIVLGASVPALGVYRSEVFPTGARSLGGYLVTSAALVSGSAAVLATGALLDRGSSHAEILGVLALGQLVVAAIVLTRFPETAHRELEDVNPEDRVSGASPGTP